MMSGKDFFWAGGERCILTEKMLHPPAGHSRSLGQQRGTANGGWSLGRREIGTLRDYNIPCAITSDTVDESLLLTADVCGWFKVVVQADSVDVVAAGAWLFPVGAVTQANKNNQCYRAYKKFHNKVTL